MIEMVLTIQDGLLRFVVAKAVIYLIENMLIKNGPGTETGNAVVIMTGIGIGILSGIEKGSEIGIEIEIEGMIMNIVPGIVEEIMRGVVMTVVVTIEKVVPVGVRAEAGAGAGVGAKMCPSIMYKEIVTAYLKMGARKRLLHPAIWLNSEICMAMCQIRKTIMTTAEVLTGIAAVKRLLDLAVLPGDRKIQIISCIAFCETNHGMCNFKKVCKTLLCRDNLVDLTHFPVLD